MLLLSPGLHQWWQKPASIPGKTHNTHRHVHQRWVQHFIGDEWWWLFTFHKQKLQCIWCGFCALKRWVGQWPEQHTCCIHVNTAKTMHTTPSPPAMLWNSGPMTSPPHVGHLGKSLHHGVKDDKDPNIGQATTLNWSSNKLTSPCTQSTSRVGSFCFFPLPAKTNQIVHPILVH